MKDSILNFLVVLFMFIMSIGLLLLSCAGGGYLATIWFDIEFWIGATATLLILMLLFIAIIVICCYTAESDPYE